MSQFIAVPYRDPKFRARDSNDTFYIYPHDGPNKGRIWHTWPGGREWLDQTIKGLGPVRELTWDVVGNALHLYLVGTDDKTSVAIFNGDGWRFEVRG